MFHRIYSVMIQSCFFKCWIKKIWTENEYRSGVDFWMPLRLSPMQFSKFPRVYQVQRGEMCLLEIQSLPTHILRSLGLRTSSAMKNQCYFYAFRDHFQKMFRERENRIGLMVKTATARVFFGITSHWIQYRAGFEKSDHGRFYLVGTWRFIQKRRSAPRFEFDKKAGSESLEWIIFCTPLYLIWTDLPPKIPFRSIRMSTPGFRRFYTSHPKRGR